MKIGGSKNIRNDYSEAWVNKTAWINITTGEGEKLVFSCQFSFPKT